MPHAAPLARTIAENRKALIHLNHELITMQEDARSGDRRIEASALMNRQTEVDFLMKIIEDSLEAIEDLGAQPKDLDTGLVDFPSIVDGQQVLLCWKLGEDSIRYYHGYEEGFSGRKPLNRQRL